MKHSMRTEILIVLLSAIGSLSLPMSSRSQQVAEPPRLSDGTINLSAPAGSDGHWATGVGNLSEQPVEEVTVDDPKAYTRRWTAGWDIPWTDEPIVEYFCTDNNLDLEHIVGPNVE
jgi:hypothetical protein